MKRLFLLLLMIPMLSLAQDREQKFAVYTFTEPGAYKDGFNIGTGIEYQMNYMYFGAQLFSFPDLNDTGYTHLIGTIGFNIHSKWNEFRVYTGIRGGPIVDRASGLIGVEGGIDFNIPKTSLYFGGNISSDYRSDGAFEDDYIPRETKNHWVSSVSLRAGIKF